MRIRNQYGDPHCAGKMPFWSKTGTPVTATLDGAHWRYDFPAFSSLIPPKTNGVTLVMIEMTPDSAWDVFKIDYSTTLLRDGGLLVADVSDEKRPQIGVMTRVATTATVTGMCYATVEEWPILQEVDATIFVADSAPY